MVFYLMCACAMASVPTSALATKTFEIELYESPSEIWSMFLLRNGGQYHHKNITQTEQATYSHKKKLIGKSQYNKRLR
jgi:hypothetical protein